MDPGQGWVTNRFSPHQAQGRPPRERTPSSTHPCWVGLRLQGKQAELPAGKGGSPLPSPETPKLGRGPPFHGSQGCRNWGAGCPSAFALPQGLQMGLSAVK